MTLNFELPTPANCSECRFGTVVSKKGYGGWAYRCLVKGDLYMPVREGLKKRNDACPGRIEE